MNSTQKDESVGFFDFFLRQILRKLGKLRKWMNQNTRCYSLMTNSRKCDFTRKMGPNPLFELHEPEPQKSCGALISYRINFQLLFLASYECEWVWAWLVTRVNNLITCIFYHKVFRQMQTRVLQPHWEIIFFLEFDQSEQSRS